jgi:molybdopterin/thiamine biosynthesis adenylyltransferase
MGVSQIEAPSYTDRFHRNIGIITKKEQERLRNATVAIAGAGGVGGNVAHILTRSGVGGFRIADHDVFSPSNMSRQYGASEETVGYSKVGVVSERMRAVNREARITVFEDGVTPENMDEFLDGADAVVDVIDYMFPAIRNELIDRARARGLHVFHPATLGFSANLLVFSPDGPGANEFFGPAPKKTNPVYRIRVGRKAFPIVPSYVNKFAYAKGLSGVYHIPTFCPIVMLTSTVAATDLILHLTGRREPVCVPKVKWIDLLEHRFEIIDTEKD